MKLLYTGKAKDVYQAEDINQVYIKYKNDVTAGNGAKHDIIENKGKLNAKITELIFKHLEDQGIKTHFIKQIDDLTQLTKKVSIIPLEVIVRNIAAGSFARNYGVKEGTTLNQPTFEFSYKKDELGDPLLNKDHAIALGIINEEEFVVLREETLKINRILQKFFKDHGIILVDFKLEFGKDHEGNIILADEFSPDNSRLWDEVTKKPLDKDNYRKGIGSLTDAYEVVLDRIENGYIKPLKEECGVVAVYNGHQAPWLTFNALHALQHRGQDSAGISWVSNGEIITEKENGLLDDVFRNMNFDAIESTHSIGHVRYATTGNISLANIHPFYFNHSKRKFAIAHNGNISNSPELRQELEDKGSIFYGESDTEILGHLLVRENGDLFEAISKVLTRLEGAFSFVFIDDHAIYAARDAIGFRPLCLGEKDGAYFVVSESVALDVVGAKFIRDIKPGELIKIDKDGVKSIQFAESKGVQLDAMELIYFARPDSTIDGINVHEFRKETGKVLAKESPVDADIVVPIPDSSLSAAYGYSEVTGIPIEMGLIKNRYIARTFIQATQSHREVGVKRKLNTSPILKGKRVILIDDSIVRGTTIKQIVDMVRERGAKEVHVRIASPVVIAPSYYGINISTYKELIANRYEDVQSIANAIGADSLNYVSVDGLRKCAPNIGLEMCIFEDKYQTFVSPQLIRKAKDEK